MLISQCHVDGPAEADGLPEAHGPPKVHGPRGHSPPCPLSRRPWMAIKTIICLSFIVLNNFFCEHECKKNCASPTKSLTAHHWLKLIFFCTNNCGIIPEPLLRMVAPGAGFCGGTLFRTKNRWRPKKRSPLQNKWVFGPKVCEDQKKNGLRLKISGFLMQMRMGTT